MKRARSKVLIFWCVLAAGALLAFAVFAGSALTHSEETSVPGQTFIPLILRNFTSAHPRPVFGVQMYGDTSTASKYHQSLVDSGATWVRVPVLWSTIEPEDVDPVDYAWNVPDKTLSAARSGMGGFQLVATIASAPNWAATFPNGPIHPDKLPEFAEFVGAVVERYDGDGFEDAPDSPTIDHWEFYNEPDGGSASGGVRWGDHGEAYAQMLASVYGAVKSANPKAQVLLGGIAYDWFEDQNGPFVRAFLDDVFEAGGGEFFDVMNFHYYPAFSYNWASTGPGLLEKTQHIRGKLGEYGYANKPIVITEAGWYRDDDSVPPSTPEIQSSYVVELFTQSLAADVKVMIWWMLYDPGTFYSDYGLVSNDAQPVATPSLGAFRTAVGQLSAATFEHRLTTTETGASDMEAYRFDDPLNQRKVLVAWLDPIDTGNTRTLQLPAEEATVYDMYGASHLVTDGADGKSDGKIKVKVGRQPIYIGVAR
jgi:hypothetical protein